MENRLLLATDAVAAVVTNTNLTITGDGGDDTFLVSGDGTAGDVVITGFTSAGGDTTLINGDATVTLTGVTGNITMKLGAGDVTVSVADLTAEKDTTITAGGGDDTIDVGTIAPLTTPDTPLSTNAVTVTRDLTITAGGGDDSVTIGETPETNPDVTVSRDLTVTVGNGDDDITELSLAVSRDESIRTGSGQDSVTIGGATVAASGVSIGRSLSVSVGSGDDDSITEESTSVTRDESISIGSGDGDTVTLGAAAPSVTSDSVRAAAISQVVTDGDVSIGGNLNITGGFGRGFGFGCMGGGMGGGNNGGSNSAAGDVIGFGHLDSLFDSSSDDTITLDNVSATRANIFTGFSDADTISITDSNFNDLGVVLGNGSGSLSITGTTTTDSTTLIGLGSSNTYTDGGGNSFANLHTHGLSPAPTASAVVETTSAVVPSAVKEAFDFFRRW